jgi:hypothetical protein
MIFIGSTPLLNGIDSPNIVNSLKPISDALRAMGEELGSFVRVPTSADIDWAATALAARPASGSAYAGVDVFRFDDELQAVAPIFIRIRYGHGPTNTPALFVQMGTGVDLVTGALTGNFTAFTQLSGTGANNGPFPIWISGGPNFFTLGVIGTAAVVGGTFQIVVERTRDHNGLETPDGAIMLSGSNGAVSSTGRGRIHFLPIAGGVPADVESREHITSVGGMTGQSSSGTDLAMAPISVPVLGQWRYMTALTYKHLDIAHGSIFDLDHLGDERQYIAFGAERANATWGYPNGATGLAVRWE